jgi:hypothetical protein
VRFSVAILTRKAGILKAAKVSQQQTQLSLDQAFQDLDALMAKAAEMVCSVHHSLAYAQVTLAETISQKLAKENIAQDETTEFQDLLLSLGISNPVTRCDFVEIQNNMIQVNPRAIRIIRNWQNNYQTFWSRYFPNTKASCRSPTSTASTIVPVALVCLLYPVAHIRIDFT